MKKSSSGRKGRPKAPKVTKKGDVNTDVDEPVDVPTPADFPPTSPPGDDEVTLTETPTLTATEDDGASADNSSDANVLSRAEIHDAKGFEGDETAVSKEEAMNSGCDDDLAKLVDEIPNTENLIPSKAVMRDQYLESRIPEHMTLQGEETEVALRRGELHYHDWKWLSEHPLTGEDEKERGKYWTHFVEEQLGVPVRTATLHRRVYEFYTHVQPVARPYLCRVGMTKLDLAITLKNAGVQACSYMGVKDLMFSPDGITVTFLDKNSEGEVTEKVYDLADPNLTVRMLRERMPESGKSGRENTPRTSEDQLKKLRAENKKIRQERDELQASNLSLQRRVAEAELQRERLLEEVQHLRAQLKAAHEEAGMAEDA